MMNNLKEPKLEIVWITNNNFPEKCGEFEECGEIIASGRHGWEKISDKRFCGRHCPLGDLYMKKYQPREYTKHVKRCKERGWSIENPSKIGF